MLLQEIEKPIVSAVQGAAAGGGAGLRDRLRHDGGGNGFEAALSRASSFDRAGDRDDEPAAAQLGRKVAFEVFSLGKTLDATEAQSLGLANQAGRAG